MTSTEFPARTAQYSAALRHELSVRNRVFSKKHSLAHTESYGESPVVVYFPSGTPEHHGNFCPEAYRAICANPEWKRRLGKIHPQARTTLPRAERRWCELDSSTSSDALLLNIFCHPDTLSSPAASSMLSLECGAVPEFGLRARVPLSDGHGDRTEVDMRLGGLLVEAKLTESDFQQRDKAVVEGYRDFQTVFERKLLPQSKDSYSGYQLIRNVLAAYATDASFCVFLDARRPDLLEQWYAVMRAIRTSEMRVRCKVLTWQELSSLLSPDLQNFLDEKYGIVPPGTMPSPVSLDDTHE